MKHLLRRAHYAALSPLLGAAIAATAYFQDDRAWRFELARATDRCGLYLYLFGPLLAGIAAFEAWTHKRRFAELAESLPQPASARMRPFVLVTAMGLALHVLVIAIYLGTALLSDPYGHILVGLLAIQFASIPGYVALGVLVGGGRDRRWQRRRSRPSSSFSTSKDRSRTGVGARSRRSGSEVATPSRPGCR